MSRLFFIAAFFSFINGFSQVRCGLDDYFAHKESIAQFEKWLSNKYINTVTPFNSPLKTKEILNIPVVFHIIHRGENLGAGTNLSDEKIIEQLQILNEDFRKVNDDQILIPLEFLDLAADTEINFVLAKQDGEGLPSQGITRQQGNQNTYNRNEEEILYSENYWPAENYLNIYICLLYTSDAADE